MTAHKIGFAAKAAGVTVETVRYYEREGLLGTASRTDAGYRLYSDADVARLQFIRKAKERKRESGGEMNDNDPDTLLICDKQRNGEWEGTIGLWYERNSQQFVPNPGEGPMVMYRHPDDY